MGIVVVNLAAATDAGALARNDDIDVPANEVGRHLR